jgi:hypothetical protein
MHGGEKGVIGFLELTTRYGILHPLKLSAFVPRASSTLCIRMAQSSHKPLIQL